MRRPAALLASAVLLGVAGCAPRGVSPASRPAAPAAAPVVATGADVLAAMHARWHGVRAPTLTFVQQTVLYRPDAPPDTSTWYEAAAPGRLRIDVEPLAERTAIFYLHGERVMARGGAVIDRQPDVNVLLLTLMDAYHQPPAVTRRMLDSLGYATAAVREGTWDGRAVWIVGRADTTAAAGGQLWIDRERLVPLRVTQRMPGGPLLDARVGDYRLLGGAWHEHHIAIWLDGRLFQDEQYRDVRPGAPVEDALFDPAAVPPPRRYWE